jgi:ketosteroid isomerase-like protein
MPSRRTPTVLHLAAVAVLGLTIVGCATAGSTTMNIATAPHQDVDQTADGTTLNPYYAVVRSKILGAFRGLSEHEDGPALSLMADDVQYTFDGDHALGGTRVSRAGVKKWFGRLFRLLPGRFVVRSVEVTGWPWRTRVVTTLEHAVTPPVGAAYWATAVQTGELRWGVAVRIRTHVDDMAKLVHTLDALAERGNAEAKASPIVE